MAAVKFVMRRHGNLSDLQPVSGDFPQELKEKIEDQLAYTHVTQTRGAEAYTSGGSYKPFSYERRLLYKYDAHGRIVFPRGFSTRVFNLCKEASCEIEIMDTPHPTLTPERFNSDFNKVFSHMDLKAKQDECLAVVSISEGGIVVAPTGFGKSFLFAAICLMFSNARIHVVTRRRDVMKRLIRHLVKYIPDVGQVGGGMKKWSRVTVITADSLHLVDHYGVNQADIVLYDEVHEAAAPSYSMELAKYQDARMYFAWNGVKWIASLKNPYTLASAVASRTKAGNYCIYGANKDFSTSYYSVPPKSYKGVKGDLWVITDKTYGDFRSMYFWTGKVWVVSTSKEAEALQKLNDDLQLKARASSKGEVCYSGSITSTQVFSTKVPGTYKGKVNDRWVVMDKKGVKANIYYYWDGKKWKKD
jgi:hypothetical protein